MKIIISFLYIKFTDQKVFKNIFILISIYENKQEMNSGVFNKTFICQDLISQIPNIFKVSIRQSSFFDLKEILGKLPHEYDLKTFKLFDFQTNSYVYLDTIRVFGTECTIPWKYLRGQCVMIKYMETIKSQGHQEDLSEHSSVKKDRSRQRTILQVLAVVKRWRELHLNASNTAEFGKKINLQQAAVMVGISKKSLDDYYYQLRLGQKYGFDFKNNLHQKIGILRTFIKEVKPKGRQNEKNEKHPKKLKILDAITSEDMMLSSQNGARSFSAKIQMDIEKKMSPYPNQQELNFQNRFQFQNNQVFCEENFTNEYNNPLNPFKVETFQSMEDQFYNEFELMLCQPNDPFLMLGIHSEQIIDNKEANQSNFMKKKQSIYLKECEKRQENQEQKNIDDFFL